MQNEGKKIEFMADSYRISGPKVDNSFTISFNLGEYEAENVSKLLTISPETILKISVEAEQ